MKIKTNTLIIAIKGAGEMATGLACRLLQSNFNHIFMMEIQTPMAVRRRVSFCEAVHDGKIIVEGITAKKASDTDKIRSAWENNYVPVIVDPAWESIKALRPHVVIDAIIAKKNIGTNLSEAPLVIGLGPGFNEADRVARAYLNNGNFHDPIASSDPDFCISKFNIPQNNIFQ